MVQKIGDYLKREREKLSFTLRNVEEKTGISNAYISQLENNKIANPSPKILHKLAELYEISYSKLLDLVGYPIEENVVKINRKISDEFRYLTTDEHKKLKEYLDFIRSRKGKE